MQNLGGSDNERKRYRKTAEWSGYTIRRIVHIIHHRRIDLRENKVDRVACWESMNAIIQRDTCTQSDP